MKIGVIGLGSMGKRRLRLLKEIDPGLEIVGIDARDDRRAEAEEAFGIRTGIDLDDTLDAEGFDAVVISTSPLSHNKIISKALAKGCHVFTELNLVSDGYEENTSAAAEKGLVLFLSSTMLYRKEIQRIKEEIAGASHPVNYIYHVGQYLPTWHKHEDYRQFFVADKRSNGCRELFAIELPWLIDTFGNVTEYSISSGRMTDLEIDYDDYFVLNMRHESGAVGCLNINVSSIKAVRNLEVYGQDIHLSWSGSPDSLMVFDAEKNEDVCASLYDNAQMINKQNSTIVEDAYRDELAEFLDVINNKAEARYSFQKDQQVLDLIDYIEGES